MGTHATNPTTTVVMSCHNASAYLAEAIESVLSQTYGDYEFMTVNDGSTDETLDILRAYASKDRRLALLNKARTGLADSLNAGLRAARGRWIARLDADDVALPDRLDKQVAFLRRHPSVALLGTDCVWTDAQGNQMARYHYPSNHRDLVRHMELDGSPFHHSSVLFDRDAAVALGGYNGRFTWAQDLDLWLRMSEQGSIACLSEPLVRIRRHSQQMSDCDSGRTQLAYGIAARICHFMRMRRAVDPSAQSQEEWRRFMEWLVERLEQTGRFKEDRERRSLRARYASAKNPGARIQCLVKGLLASKHARRFLINKWRGSNLARRLADEWIARTQRGTGVFAAE